MSMYITIPDPATFIDPGSKKKALTQDASGEAVPMHDRDHEWFLHVYILSHIQFSLEVGGGEATRAAAEIGRAVSKAIADGQGWYEVSDDNLRRIKCCYARATDEDYTAVREATAKEGGKPDPRILAKSSLGMTRGMSNFESTAWQDHFDALDGASPKKPETVAVATIPVGDDVEVQTSAN